MTNKVLRCIVCPIGCEMTSEIDAGNHVIAVTGNTCPKGKKYAESELTNPVRTLTTTVFTEDGRKLPVRTSAPIAKSKLFEAMALTKTLRISLPIKLGQVVLSDFTEKGIHLVACQDMNTEN